jgi:23S rRNA (uracil1939-C5)-methyltransferase
LRAFAQRHDLGIELQAGVPVNHLPLYGPTELTYRLPEFNLSLHFRPDDFIQANGELNQALVHQAVTLLDPQPQERLLDLFCGLGNFTLPLARLAGEVTGLEGSPAMTARAQQNARANGLHNCRLHSANLYGHSPALPAGPFPKALLDPPRSGAGPVLAQLPALGVERLLYVSCLPASLAQDAVQLVQHGYRLTAAGILDMFPHTAHVEAMGLFER